MPSPLTDTAKLKRVTYISLSTLGRLAAAFLVGVLVCLAYFLFHLHLAIGLLAVAAIGLWAFALVATRRISIPWPIQGAVMVLGFLTAGWFLLVITLSKLVMD